jgi:hypothetical protein
MTQGQTPETPETPQGEIQEEYPLAGLKVVVEVLDAGCALIGISQGEVDPHLEPCAISVNCSLEEILAVVPEVLERARERWGRQPRFPNAEVPAPTPRTGAGRPPQPATRQPQGPQTPRMF